MEQESYGEEEEEVEEEWGLRKVAYRTNTINESREKLGTAEMSCFAFAVHFVHCMDGLSSIHIHLIRVNHWFFLGVLYFYVFPNFNCLDHPYHVEFFRRFCKCD